MTEAAWSDKGMSNFDNSVDKGLEADLRAGMRCHHSAWNFNGEVWYDPGAKLYMEEVFVYNRKQATLSAKTPERLMRAVNDKFGWD